jgi:hypothetical protein
MKKRIGSLVVYALGLGGLLWTNIKCWIMMSSVEREHLGTAFWIAWIGLSLIFGLPVVGVLRAKMRARHDSP